MYKHTHTHTIQGGSDEKLWCITSAGDNEYDAAGHRHVAAGFFWAEAQVGPVQAGQYNRAWA